MYNTPTTVVMAAIFGSPSLLSYPPSKLHLAASSSQSPPPFSSSPPSQPASETTPKPATTPTLTSAQLLPTAPKPKPAAPDSTDWVASTLTRRFGLGAGLAWVGFLAAGVVSEQIKTRFEIFQEQTNTKDVEEAKETILPNGIRYSDLRVGGGASPMKGDLVVIDLMGRVLETGEVFIDTFSGDARPLALVMGSRPYTKGMCEGVEYALRSMKAGGKRKVVIPPSLGFGDNGADLGSGVQIPPSATLEFVVQVDKVSIAPS